jgi:hypothetical protein
MLHLTTVVALAEGVEEAEMDPEVVGVDPEVVEVDLEVEVVEVDLEVEVDGTMEVVAPALGM